MVEYKLNVLLKVKHELMVSTTTMIKVLSQMQIIKEALEKDKSAAFGTTTSDKSCGKCAHTEAS